MLRNGNVPSRSTGGPEEEEFVLAAHGVRDPNSGGEFQLGVLKKINTQHTHLQMKGKKLKTEPEICVSTHISGSVFSFFPYT